MYLNFTLLAWLVLGHFMADICLQSDFVALRKSRNASLDAIPWYYVLLGHAATHGLAAGLACCPYVGLGGGAIFALLETAAHFCIDFAKCEGWTDIHADQFLHCSCKVLWSGCVATYLAPLAVIL